MSEDDERAETERRRLMLVHDVESRTKNLAGPTEKAPKSPETAEKTPQGPEHKQGYRLYEEVSIDLSEEIQTRAVPRVPVTPTTDGHRWASYAASTEPVARVATSPGIPRVLVEPALALAGEGNRMNDTDPASPHARDARAERNGETAPAAPKADAQRFMPTMPRVEVPVGGFTVPGRETVARRQRARWVVAATLGALAVVLLIGVVKTRAARVQEVAATASVGTVAPATSVVRGAVPLVSAAASAPTSTAIATAVRTAVTASVPRPNRPLRPSSPAPHAPRPVASSPLPSEEDPTLHFLPHRPQQ